VRIVNWLSRLARSADTSTTVETSGRAIAVHCSASANRALSARQRPLVAELELAFACFARKQVRFHDAPVAGNVIRVNERLGLVLTVFVPDRCGTREVGAETTRVDRTIVPKWVRIDHRAGEWLGDFGL
jgi:hypothetical protein